MRTQKPKSASGKQSRAAPRFSCMSTLLYQVQKQYTRFIIKILVNKYCYTLLDTLRIACHSAHIRQVAIALLDHDGLLQ